MGYTTDFNGKFTFKTPLLPAQVAYINAFSGTRRMRRNAELTAKMPDPIREAVCIPVGLEGGYYVGDTEDYGLSRTTDILDYNRPPSDQPGLWCQWVASEDGTSLEWNQAEKFCNYMDWLQYLISNFFAPNAIELNGEVTWQGEESDDMGKIIVKYNIVTTKKGRVVYR